MESTKSRSRSLTLSDWRLAILFRFAIAFRIPIHTANSPFIGTLFSFAHSSKPLEERMSTRPTPILWYIVVAPVVTLMLLAFGSLEGLWILFFSHVILVATTLIPSFQGFGPVMTVFDQDGDEVWLTIDDGPRSEEHTSELQSHSDLVCRLLLEKKKKKISRAKI